MISSVSQIQEVIAIPQEYFWLPWAVQYFFFIGIACCATLYACWQCWKGRTGNPKLLRFLLLLRRGSPPL